jgi:hypothetical protein
LHHSGDKGYAKDNQYLFLLYMDVGFDKKQIYQEFGGDAFL